MRKVVRKENKVLKNMIKENFVKRMRKEDRKENDM
jgi:hypothetical protein